MQTLSRIGGFLACLCPALGLLTACNDPQPPVNAAPPPLAPELVLYGYSEDIPQSVLDAFTAEFGVKIHYLDYQSPEESQENIQAGKPIDVATIENQLLAPLIAAGRLAEIDFANVPNFKNLSPNFRDLAIDPGNRHSVPCSYGTTGLLLRSDLIGNTLSRWTDLWEPQYAGKIGLRDAPREIIGMTLLSLGYAFNSEDPQELAAAEQRLLALRPAIRILDAEASAAVPELLSGEVTILHGYAEDYQVAKAANPAVTYVLPAEGTALWGDSYVIPANSPHRHTAEVLINFLLRPDVVAAEVNEKKYAHPNEAAFPLISPEILDDPVIYPRNADLQQGQIILPLSPYGEKRYAEIWKRFLEHSPIGAP